jgi:Flp pilus assembly secretin CpaC
VLCTPTNVSLSIGQRIVIGCTAQGYSGPIALTVADPTVASVVLAEGTLTLFYITGLRSGTTTASFFRSQSETTAQVVIVVN